MCQLPLSSATCRCGLGELVLTQGSWVAEATGELRCQNLQRSRCSSLPKHTGTGSGPPGQCHAWKWWQTASHFSMALSWPSSTPQWSVRADGAPRRQCVGRDGAALDQARRTKELQYPELSGDQGRVRLVVLACLIGGRWSEEAHDFLRQLARARAPVEHGFADGPLRLRAALLKRSRCRCWSAVEVVASTAKCLRLVTSSGMTLARAEAIAKS